MEPDEELTDVFVGGYWWSRGETPEQIGARLHRWLGDLAGMHDDFGSWTVENRPAGDVEMLTDLISREFNPDEETGEPLEDLGFYVFGDNTPTGATRADFSLKAGATASSAPNNVLLEPPYREPFPRAWVGLAVPLIESVVHCWQPDVVVLARSTDMMAMNSVSRGQYRAPGALTWLPVDPDQVPQVVEAQTVSPLAGGALISLMDGEAMPEVDTVLELTRGLMATGLLDVNPGNDQR